MAEATSYDPKVRCCGWCYGVGVLSKCSKCTRAYCSRQCQVNDWKSGGHKFWCGNSGEKNTDYEIRDAGEKGLGLFVKRDILRGEKILVERPVMVLQPNGTYNRDGLSNENVRIAAMALAPENAGLKEKFAINNVNLGGDNEDAGSGLFVHFSRVNHDCIGNSEHYFDQKTGVKLLVANRDIPAGSEVTFSYVSNQNSMERALSLALRGFQCTCLACRTPELADKLDRMLELDRKILQLGSTGRNEAAIRAGKSLIKIYDELKSSDLLYSRTYYDLFQVAVPKRQTVKQGHGFIKKAYEHAVVFYGPKSEVATNYKQYVEQPSLHRNYRCIN